MNGPQAQPELPVDVLLQRLCDYGLSLGRQIRDSSDLTVREYLRTLVPRSTATVSNRHRELFARALERYLHAHGEPAAAAICEHLLAVPIVQLADHSSLLLNRETFLNNYLFYLACRDAGLKRMICSQCSTVVCLTRRRPITGPVFLETPQAILRLFALSKTKLKDSHFCALQGPLVLKPTVEQGESARCPSTALLDPLGGCYAPTAPLLYRACNVQLWQQLGVPQDVERIAVDEMLTSELVALHLEDSTSPVRAIVFNERVRDTFLRIKRLCVTDPDNLAVNRALPDFFWMRFGSRLYAAKLNGTAGAASFSVEHKCCGLPVPYEPHAFASALRAGQLYADQLLGYLVRCLLPGVTAVGGTSQQEYVALYQRILRLTHEEEPFLSDAELRCTTRAGASRLGGAPLVEDTGQVRELLDAIGPEMPLDDLQRTILDRKLEASVGQLRCARYLERRLPVD